MLLPPSLTLALFWIANITLLAVFVLAGISKLRDINRAGEGVIGFGVPERWAHPAVAALVLIELLIAALLISPPTQRIGAFGALGTLVVFTLAIVWQLLRGQRPACACFGSLTQSAISWKSVGRNALLMGLASALIALPDAGFVPMSLDLTAMIVFVALLWAGLSATWLLLLTRQNGRLLLRIEQLEQLERGIEKQTTQQPAPLQPLRVGDALPPMHLNDAHGRPFDQRSLLGRPALLLFLDAACSHCQSLLAHLREANLANASATLIVVGENDALRHHLPSGVTLLVDPGWSTTALFGLRGTPAAVSVDADGALAQTTVHGASAVKNAIDRIAWDIPEAKQRGPSDPVAETGEEARHELAPV